MTIDHDLGHTHDSTPVATPSRAVRLQARALLQQHQATVRLDVVDRDVSRSAERLAPAQGQAHAPKSALSAAGQELGGAVKARVPPPSPREIAMSLLPTYGWDSGQFSCLDAIWTRESDWNPYAANVTSGAYGIPQALPGSKMAAAGEDWRTDAETQIRWGLGYIRASYGSPCGAWYFWESHSWY
jgi:hypothetical protein